MQNNMLPSSLVSALNQQNTIFDNNSNTVDFLGASQKQSHKLQNHNELSMTSKQDNEKENSATQGGIQWLSGGNNQASDNRSHLDQN